MYFDGLLNFRFSFLGTLLCLSLFVSGTAMAELVCKHGSDATPPFTERVASTDTAIGKAKNRLTGVCAAKGGTEEGAVSCTVEADYGGSYIGSYAHAVCCVECKLPQKPVAPAQVVPVQPRLPEIPSGLGRLFDAIPGH